MKLILASSSPRRRELLTTHGFHFEVIEPDPGAECGICSRETPPEFVARLAYQKAANVIEKLSGRLTESNVATPPTIEAQEVIIACDTVAECGGLILGKPRDRDHAREMLHRLRGRTHHVYSGLCLWNKSTAFRTVAVDRSTLIMDQVNDASIEDYLDTDDWFGKSGGFGFQDGPPWLHLVDGSSSNVVGLPMELLNQMLQLVEHKVDSEREE